MSSPFEPRCEPPDGLFRPVPVDPSGRRGPTRGQAAGPKWVRVAPGAYVPRDVDRTAPEQRILEGACHLSPGGAVTGWGALRWAGGAFFDGLERDDRTPLPVPLALGATHGRRTPSGVKLSYEALDESEVLCWRELRIALPASSLSYEIRATTDWREAVVMMDMAAAAELVSLRRMHEHHVGHRSRRHADRVGKALARASEHSRSPAESRLRLLWEVDAGLPRPEVNRWLFDLQGRLICIPDLLDVEAGMVVEYDGAEHRRARRHTRDVAREEACRRAGLEYCKITGLDMRVPAVVLERLVEVRSRASFRRPGERAWTLTPPPGRARRESLDEKLDRKAWLAEQLAQQHGVVVPPW